MYRFTTLNQLHIDPEGIIIEFVNGLFLLKMTKELKYTLIQLYKNYLLLKNKMLKITKM